jgi:hypothetical protein
MQAGKYIHSIIFLPHFFPFEYCLTKCNTYGETVLAIEMFFHFSPQFLFETPSTVINIYQVTQCMKKHTKYPLLLTDSYQNWNVSKLFSKNALFETMKTHLPILNLLHVGRQTKWSWEVHFCNFSLWMHQREYMIYIIRSYKIDFKHFRTL